MLSRPSQAAGRIAAAALLVFTAGVTGCLGSAGARYAVPEAEQAEAVYVIRHGWHTRLAVRQAAIDPGLWPESRDIGTVAWLEAGWGDRAYYPDPDPSIWDAVKTVIGPTPAALHVGGWDWAPPEVLGHLPMVRILVSPRGVDGLARFVHCHYELRDGQPVRIRAGNYRQSWFYLATGRYHAAFNNSNVWVARALAAAGLPMSPSRAATAGSLMEQVERLGTATRVRASGSGRPPAIQRSYDSALAAGDSGIRYRRGSGRILARAAPRLASPA